MSNSTTTRRVGDKARLGKGVVEKISIGGRRPRKPAGPHAVPPPQADLPNDGEPAVAERSPWDDEPGVSVPLFGVVAAAVVALAVGLGAGWYLFSGTSSGGGDSAAAAGGGSGEREVLYYRNPMNPAITSPVPAQDEMGMDYIPVYADEGQPKEREILYYRNPMNPAITSPVPAQDEMGMDYIPVYADEGAGGGGGEPAGTVQIDPVTVQNIGVRWAEAKQQQLGRSVRAVGRVEFNEEYMARLHPKIAGWVETLHAEKTGEPVGRNEPSMSIYSPELVASQHEFLLALSNRDTLKNSPFADIGQGAEDLLRSARQRLLLLDFSEQQLRTLERTREVQKTVQVYSPFDGIVMNIGVREGQYVTPSTELYMLTDLRRVWVHADVYEHEMPWISVGDAARMTVVAAPGKVYEGEVTYIYPFMDAKTRTVQVRLEFDNEDMTLKPDMFANVVLEAGLQVDAVVVPSEAVVRSGDREQVFVVRDEGKFEPRDVELGVSAQGLTQVLAGLEAGERVVTSSQFLIDSESKLREATAKMMEAMAGGSADTGDMDMGDMDMSDMDMSDMAM